MWVTASIVCVWLCMQYIQHDGETRYFYCYLMCCPRESEIEANHITQCTIMSGLGGLGWCCIQHADLPSSSTTNR